MSVRKLVFLFLISIVLKSEASELIELNTNLRALGMGNAYTSIVTNSESVFYNPAGLADAGYYFRLASVGVGASGVDAYESFQGLSDNASFAEQVQELYGKKIWLGAGGNASITLPYFAAVAYSSGSGTFQINNPAYSNVDVQFINDYGLALGAAVPLGPFLSMGAALHRITRTGATTTFEAGTVAELDAEAITDSLQRTGNGYGLHLGANLTIPTFVKPTLSFVWKNVGTTQFTPGTSGGTAPPEARDEMILGASLQVDVGLFAIRPSFDYKYLNRSDIQLGKKIHLGLELDLPVIDIRGGFSQGYYTAGVSTSLGFMQVEAATWGVELGEYPGQLEDRRYAVQLTIELGFSSNFSFLGGSDSDGKGSGSARRRGLKQRR